MGYSNTIAVGFFTGICFMATIVVILTAFYFAAPRPERRAVKTKGVSSPRTKTSAARKQTSASRPPLFGSIRLFQRGKSAGQPQKQIIREGPAVKEPGISEKVTAGTKGAPGKIENKRKGLYLKMTLLKSVLPWTKGGEPATNLAPSAQKIKHLVAIANAEIKEPEPEKNPSSSSPSVQKVDNNSDKGEIGEKPKAREAKPEPNNRPAVPLIKIVNQKSGKSEMDDKPKVKENRAETNNPGAQTADEKSGVSDISQEAKTKEAKPEADSKAVDQPAKIVNEKAGVVDMDNKATEKSEKSEMGSKPKAADSSDFSGLFTDEDIEENESDRLAKEMNDIQSEDILEESRNLISQFKRR
jgi:hypothetical protein